MKILITGGAGFVGHHTANTLTASGHQVRVLDTFLPQVHPHPKEAIDRLHPEVEVVKGDVRNPGEVGNALEGMEAVYHFAAETGVGQSMYEMDRYVDVNVRGTAVLCQKLAERGSKVRRLILASSRAVYGEGRYGCGQCGDVIPPLPRTQKSLESGEWDLHCPRCGSLLVPRPSIEETPLRPISIYGMTKRAQEDLVEIFSRTFQIPSVILRYFNVYGSGQSLGNPYTGIAATFYRQMAREESVDIFEDGAMLRDFVHIRDVVQANLKALALQHPDVVTLNIGSGQASSVLRLAELVKKVMDSRSAIQVSGRYRLGDIRHSWGDISRAEGMIGYLPGVSLSDGLREFIDWAKDKNLEGAVDPSLRELSDKGLTGIGGGKSGNR